jgi:hypothetical protein
MFFRTVNLSILKRERFGPLIMISINTLNVPDRLHERSMIVLGNFCAYIKKTVKRIETVMQTVKNVEGLGMLDAQERSNQNELERIGTNSGKRSRFKFERSTVILFTLKEKFF